MGMTDRNTISQVIESLFEDWILTNKNIHPLAVENMRLLEADALALLKEREDSIPVSWLEEKLVRHPELPDAITDGIINVLDLWEDDKQDD